MIITGVETIPLRIPFKAGSKSDASAWGDSNLPAADSLLVKVTTDQGLVGWGEAFGFRAVASAKLAVDELIARSALDRMRRASHLLCSKPRRSYMSSAEMGL
jgi:L-alanine-DL-glutamate epimerase-like enolase superfamily enzyme